MAIPNISPRKPLKIHPTPFKPSFLSIPASPFSPLTPLTAYLPTPPPPSYLDPKPASHAQIPLSPLQWLWTCHQCHRTYALGVTRRCLEDGHFFCAGLSPTINWRKSTNPRKKRAGRACGSEFDYAGWKAWGRWKRSGQKSLVLLENPESVAASLSATPLLSSSHLSNAGRDEKQVKVKSKKDCWKTCDYPSECRWGRRFGVHTPLTPIHPTTNTLSPIFPTIDFAPAMPVPPPSESQPPTTFEGILRSENVNEFNPVGSSTRKMEKKEKSDFWNALARAALRRGAPPSSPLTRSLEEEDEEKSNPEVINKDADGDIAMDYYLSGFTAKALVPATLTDIIAKTKKSTRSRSKSKVKRSRIISPTPQRTGSITEATPAAAAVELFDFGFDRPDAVNMDFAPLERVKSRDSGYYSKPGSVCGGGP